MIKITFLGTVSGIPSKERNHPAIVFEYFGENKETLLFDCGEGTQTQLQKAGISFMDIDKIFITHWHADHFAGLIPLLATMNLEKRTKDLQIFAPEAERFVGHILDLGYFGTRFPIIATNVPYEGSDINEVDSGEEYKVFSIPAFHTVPAVVFCFKENDKSNIDLNLLKKLELKRGPWLKELKKKGFAEVKGTKVKLEDVATITKGLKVVYTGDTKPNDNVVKISERADILIHDATFLEADEVKGKAHADVKQAAAIAKKADVKQLILTNISRRYKDAGEIEKTAKKVFKNSKVAYDFMEVKIKN
jgi:ribonuclease Z